MDKKSAGTNDKPKKANKAEKANGLVPPEEQFWKRYSPHYEFPLSSASSVVLHVTGLGLLILGGILAAGWAKERPPDVDAIVIAGGGGQPGGADGPRKGPDKTEVVQEAKIPTPTDIPKDIPKEDLKKVDATPTTILPKVDTNQRVISESVALGKNLDSVAEAARKKIEQMQLGSAPRGRGGPGDGGGKGAGHGTGVGNLEGPGVQKITKRQQRQLRWTMIFNTRDGDDYARQLQGLKAILALPIPGGKEGEYLVIEDLGRRPAAAKQQDLSSINRIYWIDDRADSVGSLSRALGLSPTPPYVVAFFPEQLEKDLLEKELAYHHIPEERIVETRFQVRRGGRGYEPYVVDQQTKR